MQDRSAQTSRETSPPLPPLKARIRTKTIMPRQRFREAHPYIYGGLIGAALTGSAALYSRYHKPINKFVSHVGKRIGDIGNYAKRMTQNALIAIRNTPFKETVNNSTEKDSNTAHTPNPTPLASSGNEEYDRNHKNTISEKH